MAVYDLNGNKINNIFKVTGEECSIAYDKEGTAVFPLGTDYDVYSADALINISSTYTQGMDIYNEILFQFRGSASQTSANNTVNISDFATGASIYSNMAIDSGHGNAVAFSKTFYDPTDEFPIIYCGDWDDPLVHVNRISRTAATHLYDIVMDAANTGYHPNPCIDFDNEIMYMVGYATTSTTDSTNNYIIVSKWDLSDMTDNGDGTFTPALLDSYTRDFIYVLQDLKFNDGYIWITSGMNNSTMYLRAMEPETGVFAYTIIMPITTEIEGLSWHVDEQTGLWFAYIGFQGGIYYKVTFTQA